MAIVDMQDLLAHADRNHYTLPMLTIGNLLQLRSTINAAERASTPLVLVIDTDQFDQWQLETLLPAIEAASKLTPLPCAIAATNIHQPESAIQTIRLGCNTIITAIQHADIEALPRSCGICLLATLAVNTHSVAEQNDDALANYLQNCGSADQASSALAATTAWAPVEHLIIYNVSTGDDQQVEQIMQKGREMLGSIPGVRYVFTGRSCKDESRYRYTWLVRFAHPRVIDSYREHPVHREFADTLFRPIAGDRISIDFQEVALPAGGNTII